MPFCLSRVVIPAEAGIQCFQGLLLIQRIDHLSFILWIPAFAGMTLFVAEVFQRL
jgi:hypothetical protein